MAASSVRTVGPLRTKDPLTATASCSKGGTSNSVVQRQRCAVCGESASTLQIQDVTLAVDGTELRLVNEPEVPCGPLGATQLGRPLGAHVGNALARVLVRICGADDPEEARVYDVRLRYGLGACNGTRQVMSLCARDAASAQHSTRCHHDLAGVQAQHELTKCNEADLVNASAPGKALPNSSRSRHTVPQGFFHTKSSVPDSASTTRSNTSFTAAVRPAMEVQAPLSFSSCACRCCAAQGWRRRDEYES